MKCSICGKQIVLTPSAQERAAKTNQTAAYYTSLFTTHADCFLRKRASDTADLMQRTVSEAAAKRVVICHKASR